MKSYNVTLKKSATSQCVTLDIKELGGRLTDTATYTDTGLHKPVDECNM